MADCEAEDQQHVADNLLELYALNRLAADQLAAVEEHLLVCPECQGRLKEADACIKAMQAALRKLEGQ